MVHTVSLPASFASTPAVMVASVAMMPVMMMGMMMPCPPYHGVEH